MVNNILTATKLNTILDKHTGRTVTLTPRTAVEDNITGNISFTTGTTSTPKVHFMRMSNKWVFDKAGRIDGGDAVLISKSADGVKKDDLITADSVTYVVRDIINVPGVFDSSTTPTMIYSYSNLFVWQ